MEDTRYLQHDGQRTGPFTVQQLYRMRQHGEIDNHTLFWSDRRQQWLTLVHLLLDIYPPRDRVNQMRQVGIKRVKVIGWGPGWEDRTCDACRKLTERGYSIDAAPELPPQGCSCTPWCGCLIIAQAHDD